ncbi:MAG: hypothetical protein ACOCP4_05260 [Candidatus Woesearchaeota archaeon]
MKIGFVSTNNYVPGGSEYLWAQTAKYLCELGIEVVVSVPKWEPVSVRF